MKTLSCAALGFAFLITTGLSPAIAQNNGLIPNIAQALLEAAYESGDPAEIAAATKAVKAVFPDYEAAISDQSATKISALIPAEASGGTPAQAPVAVAHTIAAKTPTGGLFAVSPWEGKIEASALFSSGNSENSAVGILIDASRVSGSFVHNVDAFFNLGSSAGVLNQKRWGAAYKLDYTLSERTYAYGRIAYEEDEFSGFDYRLFAGAGLGHYFAKSDHFTWKVEGGPGYRYSPIDLTREIDQNFAAYASSEIDWLIREGLTFEQDWNVTWTSPTTTFQSITSLNTVLWGDISTGISFEYRYETNPPLGRENTDTLAKASLIYGF